MKRLIIVADHSFVVEAIRLTLRQTPGFEVAGYVNGRNSCSTIIASQQPHVVLVDDMGRPEMAVERIGEITAAAPDATVVLLTMQMDAEWLDDAMDAGAHAIVSKAVHPVSLGTLVREIAAGSVYHRYNRATPANAAARTSMNLTARELEILGFVASGASNAQIARQLWVTEQTVKFHLSNMYRKLGVANRTEAAFVAHTHNLLGAAPTQLAS